LFAKSIPGIEFLSGFQVACDSIIKTGTKVNLNVYDTPADSAAAVSFFANKQFKSAALWVGPFHSHAASSAAKAAKNTNTLLVLPYSSPNKVLLGNENVLKITPSLPTGMENLSAQLIAKNKNTNFILLHNGLGKEIQIVNLIKKTFKAQYKDSLKEIIYKTLGLKGLTGALTKNKNNMIIVASSDQAFVTDLFNKLKGLDEDYKIAVTGMDTWINYDNLDINMIQKLNLQIPANSFIDYNDTITSSFIKSYREKYNTEPGKYAYSGYDAAMYFIPLVLKYGDGAVDKIEANKKTCLSTSFDFKKTGDDSGFENQSIFILKYEDFELKKQ
jgi:ABC-type branched-subunit amino acid transport system substrate-binding protein